MTTYGFDHISGVLTVTVDGRTQRYTGEEAKRRMAAMGIPVQRGVRQQGGVVGGRGRASTGASVGATEAARRLRAAAQLRGLDDPQRRHEAAAVARWTAAAKRRERQRYTAWRASRGGQYWAMLGHRRR